EELAIKERTLKEMEVSIRAEAVRVEKLHAEIRQMLDEAQNIKDKRVRQLVDMISNTKAKKAAEILQTMDTDLAVKVLSGMRGRQAGEILSFVEAKKAAELSERLTLLQIPFMEEQ
ncbi:MAG: magnesium transporter MgtE, partial [Proteobacteria bacterium]|nr:magnesium transporter MgtE [Pseudomonadota bacterium]